MHSLVRATEGSLEREDYCDACWAADRASGAYSLWTLSFYDPKVADQEPPEVFSPLRRLFDYRAPAGVPRSALQPGMRLRVPFGRREMIGVLIEVT
ncbi:MAG TPA: hypothetical protein PKL84_11380, partial [Candidatus Hydrogenedentes bacterium]|nr:hypothetical protein [Candidatus Hydrogenedentota bacterium]